ncbi:DUF423 domain-containing protein [Arcicella sp. LKC2W]|uniref:DUF423 domain-containing protein n=1 Tax=Arcicella sp. LKC2W TaxID=2984198 RepID=UPI002B21B286|nr:DUF423 domain-containing protein [Arcicella sp. LKC2W]MEA5461255.1 DUF423 domain-containing protein [Arcicella sp. LKC2W]
MNKFFIQSGAVLAGLSVALGAFGAHAFKVALEATNRTETFETAAHYQMYGGLALILVGILTDKISHKFLSWAGNAFLIGTVIFSGSLYLICATGVTMWGAVAPIGGTSLMIGWVLFLVGVSKKS